MSAKKTTGKNRNQLWGGARPAPKGRSPADVAKQLLSDASMHIMRAHQDIKPILYLVGSGPLEEIWKLLLRAQLQLSEYIGRTEGGAE